MSSERRGGRNNEYNANRCIAMHAMTSSGARGALTRYEVIPVKGETSGKISAVFCVFGQMNRRGKLRVRYARDAWRTNRPRIRIRLIVLSNFHVESIFHLSYDLLYINSKRFK